MPVTALALEGRLSSEAPRGQAWTQPQCSAPGDRMTAGTHACTGKCHEKALGKEATVCKRKQITKQDVQHCPTPHKIYTCLY